MSKQQEHNLKRKAADSEEVEEDSENDVVESPEIKRARMEYLKRLYHGNKQQSEEEMEEKEESDDKAEIQKKRFEDIWHNAKQSEVEMKEKEGSEDETEIQKKTFEDIWHNENMLKHVAPIPAIAEAITDTPDAQYV